MTINWRFLIIMYSIQVSSWLAWRPFSTPKGVLGQRKLCPVTQGQKREKILHSSPWLIVYGFLIPPPIVWLSQKLFFLCLFCEEYKTGVFQYWTIETISNSSADLDSLLTRTHTHDIPSVWRCILQQSYVMTLYMAQWSRLGWRLYLGWYSSTPSSN